MRENSPEAKPKPGKKPVKIAGAELTERQLDEVAGGTDKTSTNLLNNCATGKHYTTGST